MFMRNNSNTLKDEYLNETDNLIYCSKCHTPKQTRVVCMGKIIMPTVLCKCERERRELEESKREKDEVLERISRLKASGLQDRSLLAYTFENDLGYNPEIQKAHDYVSNWEEMNARSLGLLIFGDVGTGKSFIAGCIANALLEKQIPVLMTNFSRILNTLTGMFSEDKNRFIDSLNAYSLLIIDDLGIERNSEFALEQVFNVIDSRYRSNKPLIVTTNLTLDELKNPADLAHKRIYERVLERCIPLKINTQNIRRHNAQSNISETRRLFDTGK
jgi:DNA replication protein DnaC